jgi:hypothetical protein
MKKYAIILVVVAIVAWLLFFKKKAQPTSSASAAQPTKQPTNPIIDNGVVVLENWLRPTQPVDEMPTTQAMRINTGADEYRAYDAVDRCIDKCLQASGGSGAAYDKCVKGCAGLSANYTNHNDIWSFIAKSNQLNLIKLPAGSVQL